MKTYKATATVQYNDQKNIPPVFFKAENDTQARTWVINHLDCSYCWIFEALE